MNIDSVLAGGTDIASTAVPSKNDPDKVLNAAKQFEALLIGQMMKSMQDNESGWLGTGDDESSSAAMEYGQEVFAQAMSAGGGLGLAKLVASGLYQKAKG